MPSFDMTLFHVGSFAHLKDENIHGKFMETPAGMRLAKKGKKRKGLSSTFVLALSYIGK